MAESGARPWPASRAHRCAAAAQVDNGGAGVPRNAGMVEAIATWKRLGRVFPSGFAEARLELHRAVRCAAAPGASQGPPTPDSANASLAWSRGLGGFLGCALPAGGSRTVRTALRVVPWSLALVDGEGRSLAEGGLTGRSPAQLLAWLGHALAAAGVAPGSKPLALPTPEPRAHRAVREPAFGPPRVEELEELARWYEDADAHLRGRLGAWPGATPVRCWPHHFDLATSLVLDRDGEPAHRRSIGIGMSPGDEDTPQPYWYVTPWPAPTDAALPELAGGGRWHLGSWIGAQLPASALAATSAAQHEQVGTFLDAAIASARGLLERARARNSLG